jgi:hypothetical protein
MDDCQDPICGNDLTGECVGTWKPVGAPCKGYSTGVCGSGFCYTDHKCAAPFDWCSECDDLDECTVDVPHYGGACTYEPLKVRFFLLKILSKLRLTSYILRCIAWWSAL